MILDIKLIGSSNFILSRYETIKKDIRCIAKDGMTINLKNSKVIRIDYILRKPKKLEYNNSSNSQTEDIEIEGMLVASKHNGYVYIKSNEIYDNKNKPLKYLPEIELRTIYEDRHSIREFVNSTFINFSILDSTSDILNDGDYSIYSFGYNLSHSLELELTSIALKDSSNNIHICNLKQFFIESQFRDLP